MYYEFESARDVSGMGTARYLGVKQWGRSWPWVNRTSVLLTWLVETAKGSRAICYDVGMEASVIYICGWWWCNFTRLRML